MVRAKIPVRMKGALIVDSVIQDQGAEQHNLEAQVMVMFPGGWGGGSTAAVTTTTTPATKAAEIAATKAAEVAAAKAVVRLPPASTDLPVTAQQGEDVDMNT